MGRQIVAVARQAGYKVFAPRSAGFNLETGAGVADYFRACAADGKKIDAVVHSAAYYGGLGITTAKPFEIAVRNLRMATTIFEQAIVSGVKKIVSVGSGCAYPGDLSGDLSEHEMFNGRCHDSVEGYGYTKRLQMVLLSAAHKQHGVTGVQLALTNLYGEHDVFQEYRSHVVAALIKKVVDAHQSGGAVKAWGTGKPIRQFLNVKDAAKVIVKALEWNHDDTPVNVGGEHLSIRELTDLICKIVGLPRDSVKWDATKPDGVGRKVLNDDKLRNLYPDYRPIPFREGLEQTIKWYIANKESADSRS